MLAQKNRRDKMAKTGLSGKIGKIIRILEKREKEQDAILVAAREAVRHCSVGIKLVHAGQLEAAKKEIASAEKKIAPFSKTKQFEYLLLQPYQEIAEAKILLAAAERKKLPGWEEIGMPFEPYLLGLCDAVGELRRQMLEMLKSGNAKEAERYFGLMSEIHDELLPIRFSNSLLPAFKKKQDVVRMQTEQARSELARAKIK
jgi:translin